MNPIAVFYHVYMGGGSIPANGENCFRIVIEQIEAMTHSGLIDSGKIVVGVAGTESDHLAIETLFGNKAEVIHVHGSGELPTMKLMQDYCKCNPRSYICYLHTKGAIHNGNPTFELWRHCMQKVVVMRWRECARALECGYETTGAHWLTPIQYPFIGPVPYWGGNFFWATAEYLNTLPEIDVNADRYQAEVWIGKSQRRPRVRDYARHFPMSGCTA
jgi:hypothetical protein